MRFTRCNSFTSMSNRTECLPHASNINVFSSGLPEHARLLSPVGKDTASFFETFGIAESQGELRICACLACSQQAESYHTFDETLFPALDSWSSDDSLSRASVGSRPAEVRDTSRQHTRRARALALVWMPSALRLFVCTSFPHCTGAQRSSNVL